ncbi:Myosin-XVIIIa [Harpegnathos saltator]|uniref:Myosin-XVIIIa n=1 Tax=Harpegnathos saltator TaxID=610380 RepID=E2B6T7_HARSA|nr:Myosin-XVIIIa [Harpegnathos saltator]
MPRSKDEVDKVSLGAHRLLHRSCRGKAHGSGIAKQSNCRIASTLSSRETPRSPVRDPVKSCVSGNAVPGRLGRKHSRNSTSSWECSDSDSMHSSEIGQNGCPVNAEVHRSPSAGSNRGGFADRAKSDDVRERIKRSHGGNYCSPLPRGSKGLKKETWADTLRVGCIDDKIKRMEKGWDDSNVIRTPKERKWQRITAEIEQRIPNPDNGLRMFDGMKNGWAGSPRKISERSRGCHQRCPKAIQDIIEWEELVELALARKIRRKVRGKGNGMDRSGVLKSVKAGEKSRVSGRVKDEGECMKRLEVLLENRVPPQLEEARSEEHLAQEQAWLTSEKVWLLHRGGFTPATRCGSADPDTGKLRIRLTTSGEELLVDEEDVEKVDYTSHSPPSIPGLGANPPQFDKAEELSQLRFLNESSVLHTLRQRYASNLIHTYAGDSMIVINPVAPLAIYSEKASRFLRVAHMFRGCKSEDMPPHIYAIAQSAYRGMLATRRDHSLVFLGRSGAGKTTNFKHALHYLVLAAGTVNKILTIEKLNALFTVLEAFGNSRTHMNSNATRFTQLFSLDFDQSGQIASASLQVLLLEKSRIGRRANADPTFHAVYRLLAGAEGALRKELHLTNLVAENNPFVTPLQKHEDKQRAMVEFNRIVVAFRILGVSEADEKVIWLVLAGIYHLSCAGAVKAGTSSQSRWQFARVECAEKAANLLGTTVEELSRVVFSSNGGGAGTPSTPRPALRTPSPTEQGKDVTGLDALEGLLVGLYSEVFHCVAALINKSISSAVHTVSSLLLCDSPGFQNPASCGRQTGASFEDLCHNYLQERLQLLFHHTTLVAPKDRYVQEGIDVDYEDDYDEDGIGSPQGLVSLLDRGSSQSATMLRTSQSDLSGGRQIERKGLLWLLDEETMLLRKAPGNNQFVLQHLLGTNPVLYTATGWLKATRENPVAKSAITILQESTREHASMLFVSARGAGVSGALCSSMPGLEGSQSLRRASSIRRTFTAVKRKNVCLQVKFTVDGLIETLRRTRVKFVHCLLPQHNAGCTDNKSLLSVKSNQSEDSVINVPLLRSQIRGSQIIDAVRLHKVGFPKHMALGEFRRRFGLLSSDVNARPGSPVTDERRAVEDMLLTVDVDPASYRVGQSQVSEASFFLVSNRAVLSAKSDVQRTRRTRSVGNSENAIDHS